MRRPAQRQELQAGSYLTRAQDSISIGFDRACPALSSAVYNGGYTVADNFLNYKVPGNSKGPLAAPEDTLGQYAREIGLLGTTVGMMTAASLDSLRVRTEVIQGESLSVVVTTGMENARRAGDPADVTRLRETPDRCGTINLAIVTTVELCSAAFVEAVMIVTEAKAAALQLAGIASPVSGELATGTGTDAVAVFAAGVGAPLRYVGKHTVFGERLAALCMEAIADSLDYKAGGSTCV